MGREVYFKDKPKTLGEDDGADEGLQAEDPDGGDGMSYNVHSVRHGEVEQCDAMGQESGPETVAGIFDEVAVEGDPVVETKRRQDGDAEVYPDIREAMF